MDYEQQLTTPGHDQDEQQKLQQYEIIVEHEPYALWIFDYVYIYYVPILQILLFFTYFDIFTFIHMKLGLKYS